MASSWQGAYLKLVDFIDRHNEIKIEADNVRLPDNIRAEFYDVFNRVRQAFINEEFPALISEARNLSKNYLMVEKEVRNLLALEDLSMDSDILRFLCTPSEQLIREIYEPLFSLIKGKIHRDEFETLSSNNIKTAFASLSRLGYEKWVSLSLTKLLEANELFQVPPPKLTMYDMHKSGGSLTEQIGSPKISKNLKFQYESNAVIAVSDFIIQSAKLGKYVASRSQLDRSYTTVANASGKREWYSIDYKIDFGTTLIYIDNSPENIALTADANRICRPDLVIVSEVDKNWHTEKELLKIKEYHDKLKPVLGTYIISKEKQVDMKSSDLEDGIIMLGVGFDQSRLKPVVDVLIQN